MGYTTEFTGSVAVSPPLNKHEAAYLRRFADTRRMLRHNGPYYTGTGDAGQDQEPDIIEYGRPPDGQPGLWCHWAPTDDGAGIEWDGCEKFYSAEKWMPYLIDTFLRPGAQLKQELADPVAGWYYAPEFEHFTFDHVINGTIDAEGEEEGDVWQLIVMNNDVSVVTTNY